MKLKMRMINQKLGLYKGYDTTNVKRQYLNLLSLLIYTFATLRAKDEKKLIMRETRAG